MSRRSKDSVDNKLNEAMDRLGIRIDAKTAGWKASWVKKGRPEKLKAMRNLVEARHQEREEME